MDVYVIAVCAHDKRVVSFVIMRFVLGEGEKRVDDLSRSDRRDVNSGNGKGR